MSSREGVSFSGDEWYEEVRPVNYAGPFRLVMVVCDANPTISYADVDRIGDFAKIAALRLKRRAEGEQPQ